MKMIRGSPIDEMATDKRLFIPPENVLTRSFETWNLMRQRKIDNVK